MPERIHGVESNGKVMDRRIAGTHTRCKEAESDRWFFPFLDLDARAQGRMVAERYRCREEALHIPQPLSVGAESERYGVPLFLRWVNGGRKIMVYERLHSRPDVLVAERSVQFRRYVIRTEGDHLLFVSLGRGKEHDLTGKQGVAGRSDEERVDNHVSAQVIGFGSVHVNRHVEACPETRSGRLQSQGSCIEMPAEKVEIDFGIDVVGVNEPVERDIQMGVVDVKASVISMRGVTSVDMDVVEGIAVIGQFPHVCNSVSAELPFVNLSLGGSVECGGAEFVLCEQVAQPELSALDTCIVVDMLKERVGAEGAVSGDGSEFRAEGAVESKVMEASRRSPAVMYVSQPVNLLRQSDGPAVQLREDVLYLRGVGVEVPQVGTDIGVVDVGQSEDAHLSFEHLPFVVPKDEAVETERVEGAFEGAVEGDGSSEIAEFRNEETDVGGCEFSLPDSQRDENVMRGPAEVERVSGWEADVHAAHVESRLGQLSLERGYGQDGIGEHDACLDVLDDEGGVRGDG